MCYNSVGVTDISKMLVASKGFRGRAIEWCQQNSTQSTPLSWQQNLTI